MKLAVFGAPVAQSLSSRIHGQFAAQFGLRIDYQAIESDPEQIEADLRHFMDLGGRGCNITVPFKSQAFELAQEASPLATLAMAANTLTFKRKDCWVADNTDGPGLLADLQHNQSIKLENKRICLLGAGGAAAGVLASLLATRPDELVIANRTAGRAVALAQRHGDHGRISAIGLDTLDGAGPFDLVVNATTLGHAGQAPQLEANWLTPGGLCYDMNYGAVATPLRKRCAARHVRYQDGLGMLVEQAALSFSLWIGLKPDSAPVLSQLRAVP